MSNQSKSSSKRANSDTSEENDTSEKEQYLHQRKGFKFERSEIELDHSSDTESEVISESMDESDLDDESTSESFDEQKHF